MYHMGSPIGYVLLFVTNNNKFQINVTGTIVKEDENGVHDEDKDDEINININPTNLCHGNSQSKQ